MYKYDKLGRVTNKTIGVGLNRFETNELIQEDNQVLNKTVLYTYDAGGNIRSKQDKLYGVPITSQPPAIVYEYYDDWKDKLRFYNGIPIDYDDIGNPVTIGVPSDPKFLKLTWEEGRRLKSIISSENNVLF